MAKRGRKPKNAIVASPAIDHAKLLKQFEEEQRVQLEELYTTLAKMKNTAEEAQEKIGDMDSVSSIAEAGFKAGRAYGSLIQICDKLEEILDGIFEKNDFEYYGDIDSKL